MIGYNTAGSSSDKTQYQGIIDILTNTSLTESQKHTALKLKFDEAAEGTKFPDVSPFLADYMLDLDNRGLMEQIQNPLNYATCSFVDPGRRNVVPAVPVEPFSKCGYSFGSELMFSHSLHGTGAPWNAQDFEIAKVAKGGTEIYRDWNIQTGALWHELNNTIHTTVGTWRGFVWHQGTTG